MNEPSTAARRRLITSWAGLATLILVAGFVVYLAAWFSPLRPALETRRPADAGAVVADAGETLQPPPVEDASVGADLRLLVRAHDRLGAWLTEEWTDHLDRKLAYIAVILGLLLAEKAMPAVRAQNPLSNGFFVDLGYTVFCGALFLGLFAPVYDDYLTFLYEHSFAHLEFSLGTDLHWLASLAIAILFGDFMAWFHHLLRHKVPFFWEFHAVHHSQEEMNALTDYRVHPIDILIAAHIQVVPILLLTNSLELAGTYLFVSWLLPKIYHANLKTNFGPLRYILVTPQSHRVHHSRHPDHVDTNFGVIFSIWDHIFGTQFRNYDIYPETGISDAGYPNERGRNAAVLPWLFVRQQFHPIFRVLGRPT
jgi:sterol desaturase/sphingolipid hydroxylase (fatty acid hydroxylase superfamily)